MKDKCYIHVFRLEDAVYFRCSATGKIAKLVSPEQAIQDFQEYLKENPDYNKVFLLEDSALSCPVCGRDIWIQTDELYPKVRTVRQIFSKYLDRWLNIEEGG